MPTTTAPHLQPPKTNINAQWVSVQTSSGTQVVALLQHQRLRHQLALLATHLRQDHETLLLALYETVEGVVIEGVELDALANAGAFDYQGRIADFALEQQLDQFAQEGRDLAHCLAPLNAAYSQRVHYLSSLSLQHFFSRNQRHYVTMLALEGLSEHVQHWSIERFEAADCFELIECGFEVCIDECGCDLEVLQVEVDDALERELLRSQQIKKFIKAVVLIELRYLGCQFVIHREVTGRIVEPSNHMSQIVLQRQHFPLQCLILLGDCLLLLATGSQLSNEHPHPVLEFLGLRTIRVLGLVKFLLILVILWQVDAMGFVVVEPGLGVLIHATLILFVKIQMALLKEDSDFTHVIAIDFGTGASGFAIAPKQPDQEGKLRIEVFNPCDGSDDQKTPTAILFSNSQQFLEFGVDAIQKYAEIVEEEEGSAFLFQNYKMHLLHMHTHAKSIDGREMPLLTVVQHTLRFISQQALKKLREQVGKVVPAKIRWVLTVPALWSEEHKLFMRKAAVQAEIIEHPNSQNLLLCLQPQGASIQCREDSQASVRNQLGKGKVVMVLDCGGGTVDITVHKLLCQVQEKFLCQELIPSSGGCEWGSKYVDIYFEQFLLELLGKDLAHIYSGNALARLDILRDFQIIKRKFRGQKDQRSIIKLSCLGEYLNSAKLKELVAAHNKRHDSNPEFHIKLRGSSNLELPSALMASFYQTLFENIKSKVEQLVAQVEAKKEVVDYIFMVGGFSESPFLKTEINKKFQSTKIEILVPRRPQISVVRGACLYGLNPRSITSRIAKKTYGINTLTVFDPDIHPQSKKVIIQGEEFCQDVFDAFVRKGDSVSIDQVHTKIYCPVRTRQTVMRIIFYETDLGDVEFIDEDHVRPLGELAVDIGKIGQSSQQKTVKVTLLFGHTHIYVTATNKDGNEVKNCEFKFECHNS